ncbi:hypothetical protein ABI59_21080 [Acidobacteria bacterium Mor1]|nr:hypothetical protein ABI59_21080 [Acidobacteria bacterium Mor1]
MDSHQHAASPGTTAPAGGVRVALDAKLLVRHPTGVGRYALGLTRALADMLGDDDRLVLLTGPQTCHDVLPAGDRIEHRPAPFRSSTLRSLLALRGAARQCGADVVHGLDHIGMPAPQGVASVVTVHDLLPVTHPQWFSRKHRTVVGTFLPRALRGADRVIVPTQHVATELQGQYGVDQAQIAVVPEAPDACFAPSEERRDVPLDIPEDFLLFVGRLEARKNARVVLDALARIPPETRPELVLTGLWGPEERALRKQMGTLGLHGSVHFAGYVLDDTLAELYRRSRALVFPSLAEGFGLPIVEAMAAGTAVICGDHGAMAEVAGSAALTVDPTDADALAHAVGRLASPGIRDRLVEQGRERVANLSWERTARETLEIYRRVVAERRAR